MQKLCSIIVLFISCTILGQNQKTYQLNLEESVTNWKGSYAFQFSEHTGTVHFKQGELITVDNQIIGGSFTIDMTSITNQHHENGDGPVAHLMNSDFFDVPKFPEATVVITKVEYLEDQNLHRMQGDVTIKGITHAEKFYAEVNGETMQMTTKLKLDRTRWGITYNNSMKEHAISDVMELHILLQFSH